VSRGQPAPVLTRQAAARWIEMDATVHASLLGAGP
jgi:hypothetical protein